MYSLPEVAEQLLTVEEVAKRVRRSPKTVRREIQRGHLVARKLCGGWLIREDDVDVWLERGRSLPAPTRAVDAPPMPPPAGSLADLRRIEREAAP
jgi:excisionase family DNA binding protein